MLLESTLGRWSSDKGAVIPECGNGTENVKKHELVHPADGDETAILRNYNLLVPRIFAGC